MAETASTMVALGTPAPDFSLPDVVSGRQVKLGDFSSSRALLVVFLCRHCPFVKHVEAELAKLGRDYAKKGLAMVGISANDADAYPDDAPESLKEMAVAAGFTFPLLYDESQEVARAYRATCTPDFFLYNQQRRLAYRGQLDASRPGNNKPVNGKDLRAAIDAVLSDAPVSATQRASIGCNIKWKK